MIATMPLIWTTEQILSLAPDIGIVKSARVLANPAKWDGLRIVGDIAEGQFVMSKRDPFRAEVNLQTLQFGCTCKNKKFPCNHAIALLLMINNASADFARSDGNEAIRPKSTPPLPIASNQIDHKRHASLLRGLAQLQQWLEDTVRSGLATLPSLSRDDWAAVAGKLVDHHAPALAKEVRQWQSLVTSSADWADEVLSGFGRIYLLSQALKHVPVSAGPLWNDLHAAVGWSLSPSDTDALVDDRWLIVGTTFEQSGRRKVVHAWLYGLASGRTAVIARTTNKPREDAHTLISGTILDGTLRLFASQTPLHAMVEDERSLMQPSGIRFRPNSLDSIAASYAERLALNPWCGPVPVLLRSASLSLDSDIWLLTDAEGVQVPISAESNLGWHLKSTEGAAMFGLWDGTTLTPLSLWLGNRLLDVRLLRGVA